MSDSLNKSKAYEATPSSLYLPCIPTFDGDGLTGFQTSRAKSRENLKNAPLHGFRTLTTSLDESRARCEALLKECQRLFQRRRLPELYRKVNDFPELALDIRVRELIRQASQYPRYTRGRGRPINSHECHPLLMVGLIDDFCKMGMTIEQACAKLQEWNIANADTARRDYYRALEEPRFRGLWTQTGEPQRWSREQMDRLTARSQPLDAANPVQVRKVFMPTFNNHATVTFEAED